MRKVEVTAAAIVVLTLATVVFRLEAASSKFDQAQATTKNTISVYDLDVSHRGMKTLEVHQAPLP